jgi:hypothetical protein
MSHVVVIGAGVAGLACAWSLVQRGHDVEVLESGSSLGGRIRSKRMDGFPFERGARWFGPEASIHQLLPRLGLGDRLKPVEPASYVLGPHGLVAVEPGDATLPGEPIATEPRYTLKEGLSRLTRALAEPLTVRLGWGAEAVASDSLGVSVQYIAPSGERTVRAEVAILAMPFPQARKLAPELPPPDRAAPPTSERFGLVHLGISETIQLGDVRIPSAAGLDLAGWSVMRCAEGSALRVALRAEAAERLWSAPAAAWVDHVKGQLERTPIEKIDPVVSLVDRFHDPVPDGDGPIWLGRIGATGAAGSVAGAVSRGLMMADGAQRVLRAKVIE